jgi:hypothetical protein
MRKVLMLLVAGVLLLETGCVVGVVPPPRAEVVVERPYAGAVWVPGHWKWRWWTGSYVWVHGYWRAHRHGEEIIVR